MPILVVFLTVPLICGIFHLCYRHNFEKSCRLTTWLTFILLVLTAFQWSLTDNSANPLIVQLLHLGKIDLQLIFMADKLTLVMLLLINSISLMINLYASRYIYSDINRSRFMIQLSLVTLSVTFLVMSGNLLTAFIGWQLIGFSLYWLLNHYHYDENANRAAKKKFVINRVGDMSFLLAIILCLHAYSTTDFSVILAPNPPLATICGARVHNVQILILGCVFIAVMTKSAQFLFHIWLPDTMQTPTPVSAIMHAGIINAGGFLLARLAPGLLLNPTLLICISCIGLATVMTGTFFAASQPDIKKQLAYSTMAQMGYMVLQCGLGCFAGAIIHLISHGFYKAWAFLNSGNQLLAIKKNKSKFSTLTILIAAVITGIIFICQLSISKELLRLIHETPLLIFFLFITVFQLNFQVCGNGQRLVKKILPITITGILLSLYLLILVNSNKLLGLDTVLQPIPNNMVLQIIAIAMISLSLGFLYLPVVDKLTIRLNYLSINKLFVEEIYRSCLLDPMRRLGERLYRWFSSNNIVVITTALLMMLVPLFIHRLNFIVTGFSNIICCLLSLTLLLAANRAKKLKHIVTYLILSEFLLGIIALQIGGVTTERIAYYQIVNTSLIAGYMLYVSYKIKRGDFQCQIKPNNLPWLSTYFTSGLFCLIGLPFTSTFISKIIILKELLNSAPIIFTATLMAWILISICILHTLQDYVFKAAAVEKFSIKLSSFDHVFFLILLSFNIINGLFPTSLIEIIYNGVHSL